MYFIISVHAHLKSGQVKRVGFGRSDLITEGLLYFYLKMQKIFIQSDLKDLKDAKRKKYSNHFAGIIVILMI